VKYPPPDRVEIGGIAPGETPHIKLIYDLDKRDEGLAALLGDALGQAKAASTDGTVKVVIR
jgi:hypothetical protein